MIAAGFDSVDATSKPMAKLPAQSITTPPPAEAAAESVSAKPAEKPVAAAIPERKPESESSRDFQDLPDVVDSDLNGSNDDLDVPDFLK